MSSASVLSSVAEDPFHEEHAHLSPPWRGYIEWESHPSHSALAARILSAAHPSLPTAPSLAQAIATGLPIEGMRWVKYHNLLGGVLARIPDESDEVVRREKDAEIDVEKGEKRVTTVLKFPWNGETDMVRPPWPH